MKVANYKVDEYLNNLSQYPDICCILLYGPDTGVQDDRLQKICQNFLGDRIEDKFANISITMDHLAEDEALISNEYFVTPMFGGSKLIKIKNADNNIAKYLEPILHQKIDTGNLLVITAEDLKPASKLRRLIEDSTRGIALPCYMDEAKDSTAFAKKLIEENGYQIDWTDLQQLLEVLGSNRLNIRQELQKIFLYLSQKKEIVFADIKPLLSDNNILSINDLNNACAELDANKINNILEQLFHENTNPVSIIRMIYSYFARLQSARIMLEIEGLDSDTVISRMSPPVFFKQIPSFKKHLNFWTLKKLSQVLDKLLEVELQSKDSNYDAEIVLSYWLNLFCAKFAINRV